MARLKASEIRELLKITENHKVISFGGGLPAPELFPLEEIKEVSRINFSNMPDAKIVEGLKITGQEIKKTIEKIED